MPQSSFWTQTSPQIHARQAAKVRFSVKEDVSGSTSLKSSVQRNIRGQLLSQLPYLAQPAYKGSSSSSAAAEPPADAPGPDAGDAEDEGEDEEESKGKKSKGKGKDRAGGGKSKSKKAEKLAKRAAEEDEAEAEAEEGGVTVLDEIWPKKDALGLTKWWVHPARFLCCLLHRGDLEELSVVTIVYPSTPSRARRSSLITSMDHSYRP